MPTDQEVDECLATLAESIVEECACVTDVFTAREVFGPDLPWGMTAESLVVHGQVYGHNWGPPLGETILADLFGEEESHEIDLGYDLCDDLIDEVNGRLESGHVYCEDNCLWYCRREE